MSKERSNNFSREELNKLKELLEKYSIIMNKKTDHASTKQKDEAWCQLTNEFNSNNLIYRTEKQLIYKFNNMKKNARKELSQEKKERRCTGGGPPPPKPSDTSEWLCSIMGESIVGLPSTHDSDFIFDNNTPQLNGEAAQPSVALSNIEEEMSMVSYTDGHNDGVIHDVAHIVPIHDVQENEETRETVKFDTSTPHTMLRKPLSKPLESSYRKRKLNFTPLETRKKIITVAHEKELYLKKKGYLGDASIGNLQYSTDVAGPCARVSQLHDLLSRGVRQRPAIHVHSTQLVDAAVASRGAPEKGSTTHRRRMHQLIWKINSC
ncbi:unnamed protein product [Arctia plantaginis]|uniref:Regulatory protein zeste n=1 Tax=Arctia plantaginis TaxID=874455 RepID=A0A8S0ZFY3_ARCPL|nr:unnamed protein product [Arctia plantaginis]